MVAAIRAYQIFAVGRAADRSYIMTYLEKVLEELKAKNPGQDEFIQATTEVLLSLAPVIEQLAKDYDGKIKVGKVNVDDEGALAAQFGIVSIPTIIMFVNGKPVDKLVGAHSSDDFEDMIEKYL